MITPMKTSGIILRMHFLYKLLQLSRQQLVGTVLMYLKEKVEHKGFRGVRKGHEAIN